MLLRLQHHPPPASHPHPLRGCLCPPCWGNRAAQLPGGQQLPSCPVWAQPDSCTLPCSGAAGQGPCQVLDVPSASSSKPLQEGHWPIPPSPGGKQLSVLDHLLSTTSPSHLILEELGLVLTTRQCLHKAKNLGINERNVKTAMFLAGDPREPTSSHFKPCKVPRGSWGRGCSCFALPCQSPPLAPGTGTGLWETQQGNGNIRGSLQLSEPSEIIEANH